MDNFAAYADCTRRHDWHGVCQLNGIELDSFGTKKELAVLPNYLEADEVVFALTSGLMSGLGVSNSSDKGTNTWLVVLTNDRFLFMDHALLTKSVDTQSIRHDRVQAVSASQGWLLGKIMVDIGGRTVTIDNCKKATVSVMADLANKWLKNRESTSKPILQAPVAESALDKLERLGKLLSAGVITPDEFAEVKKGLLAQL